MANTEDLLWIETDGACANCGLRDVRTLTIHHLKQAQPKDEAYDNKLLLCHNCHQCHHQDKGPTTDQLLEIKRRLIIKTLTRPGLNALKQAQRRSMVVAMPFLVNHLVEFGYLEYLNWVSSDRTESGDNVVTQARYRITPDGIALLAKWRLA
jgi:hypothetical protein